MSADLDLAFRSATDVATAIASGEVSSAEVCDNALLRCDQVQPHLNCFTALWHDEVRSLSAGADRARAGGVPLGPLHGVPIAIKETTPINGKPHTVGSFTHQHVVADRDAYVVAALRRAGAVIVGTTTSPEFAHHSITDSPMWGPTRNPWNLSRTPGGSSGGSAAAVAAGCVYLAEGSDMGGSVRIPAAWCGLAGLKPGIGRIPMDTLPGLFDSLSHHGPLARSVDDARLFLAATQGPDECDIMSVTTPLNLGGSAAPDVTGMRLGLSVDLGCWAVDPEIAAAVEAAAGALETAGAIIEPINPHFDGADEWLWLQLWGVFMAGYYGHLVDDFADRMDPDVLALIELGNSLGAAHVKRLELARTDFWERLRRVLAGRAALLCPTMAAPAPPAVKADGLYASINDGRVHSPEMTSVFNLAAPCPALSVPCGWHADGMPIGLQIVGHRWEEDVALGIGGAVERLLPQASARRPPALPAQPESSPLPSPA